MTGIAVHLTEVVIDNASMDLNEGGTSHAKISVEAQPLTSKRKRKHANAMGAHEDQPDGNVAEVKVQQDSTLISVKIAALEALEALLTVVCYIHNLFAALVCCMHLGEKIWLMSKHGIPLTV